MTKEIRSETDICFGMVGNIMENGESDGYQHFLLPHNVFERLLSKVVKSWDYVLKS